MTFNFNFHRLSAGTIELQACTAIPYGHTQNTDTRERLWNTAGKANLNTGPLSLGIYGPFVQLGTAALQVDKGGYRRRSLIRSDVCTVPLAGAGSNTLAGESCKGKVHKDVQSAKPERTGIVYIS